ncbi:MAG TPA: tetratricopeptide repeat protein, partial [Nitrospiria bacterium]|nr:tetratricopeptide repeat protein [Nitrospiria bacterium]
MKLTSLILLVLLSGCHFDLQGIGTDEPAISKDKGARDFFIEGMRLFNFREFKGARREFYKIIEDYPGSSLLHETQWMIARSYYEEGDLKDALREYRLFLKNFPESIHFQEAGSVIDSIERKIAKKGEGKIVGMKLAASQEKEAMAKEIMALYRSDVNTLVVKLKARDNISGDDLEPLTDISHRYGLQLFIEIDIRDPGWIGDTEAA